MELAVENDRANLSKEILITDLYYLAYSNIQQFLCFFQDYIWRLVLCSSDDIATKAIELLKETFTNLGPRLQASQVTFFIFFLSC